MMLALRSALKLALVLLAGSASAYPHGSPEARAAAPTTKLDQGTFVGKSSNGVSSFLGIPFALPPWVHCMTPALHELTGYTA